MMELRLQFASFSKLCVKWRDASFPLMPLISHSKINFPFRRQITDDVMDMKSTIFVVVVVVVVMKYDWLTILYQFQIYNTVIWYSYMLWNDHHYRSSYHIYLHVTILLTILPMPYITSIPMTCYLSLLLLVGLNWSTNTEADFLRFV